VIEPKILNKEQIQWAMENSLSNKAASKLLNVDYRTYRKYAKKYDLFEQHLNIGGKGVKKKIIKKGYYYKNYIEKILNETKSFNITIKGNRYKLLRTLIEYGFFEEKCEVCGFDKKNNKDEVPLLLDFEDGNYKNFNIFNLRPLCPNCYTLFGGDVYFY